MSYRKESELVRDLLGFLGLYPQILAWRQNQGALRANYKGKDRLTRFSGAKGISDIIGLVGPNGRFLAVEAKLPGNKPTDDQSAFLARVEEAGGIACLAYDVSDLQKGLLREGVI